MTLRSKMVVTFAGYGVTLGLVLAAVIVWSYFIVEDRLLNQFLDQGIRHSNRSLMANAVPQVMPGFSYYPDRGSAPEAAAHLGRGVHEIRQYVHVAVIDHPLTGEPYFLVLDQSAAGFGAILGQILSLALVVLVAASVVGIAVGGLLSRHFLTPLDTLVERVSKVDPTDPSLEPLNRGDEFGLLSDRFSELIGRLRAFAQREQDFTRYASHELRSPITVISGSASILQEHGGVTDRAQRAVARIVAATQRMSRLVEAFLHLGRGSATLNTVLLTAADIVAELRTLVVQRAEAGSPVELSVDACRGQIETDRQLLSIVLDNLIVNAARHGEGPLVADVALPRLRLSNRVAGDHAHGHGFGLEISDKICRRLGVEFSARTAGDRYVVELVFPTGA